MVEYTVGRKIYPGYVLKLNCVGDYSPDKVCRYNCFRIIMVEGGTGSYGINGKSDMYKGPSVFCLNENEFIKATGMPVIAYLISLRLKMAATFLRETLLPVSEIIGRSGFKDRSHFVRIFKKYLGLTPYEYRKKYCRFN